MPVASSVAAALIIYCGGVLCYFVLLFSSSEADKVGRSGTGKPLILFLHPVENWRGNLTLGIWV